MNAIAKRTLWEKFFIAAITGLCAEADRGHINDMVPEAATIADQALKIYTQRFKKGFANGNHEAVAARKS